MSAKDRFITSTLESEGQRMLTLQSAEIAQMNSITGNLANGRRVIVSDNTLTLYHPIYERFLDMRHLSGRKHKRRKIHNRFVYGTYSAISKKLINGFSDEVFDAMRFK